MPSAFFTTISTAMPLVIYSHTPLVESIANMLQTNWIILSDVFLGKYPIRVTCQASPWGTSISAWTYDGFAADHLYTGAGNYDATGNAAGDNYFYDTTNSPFVATDASYHKYIVINSGTYDGAKAEITNYISADGVQINAHGGCWDEDLSNVDYSIYPAPQFICKDCWDTNIHLGTQGELHIGNSGGPYVGDESIIDIYGKFGQDNSDLMHIHCDADGYSNVDMMQLFYTTGDLQAGDSSQVIQISIDETGATGGEIDGLLIETTDASAAEKHAIHVGTGFDTALIVSGASALDPSYGYTATPAFAVTDRVNSAGAGDDSFINAAVDTTIFAVDNEIILIGHTATFEVLEVILETVSSKGIVPTFEYSTGVGTWAALVVDDGTQEFTKSGLIDWSAPVGWAQTNRCDGVTGVITQGYYIRITRTYTPTIPTLPVENYFKIFLEQAGNTGMTIFGDGSIKLPYLAGPPATRTNGSIWAEPDGLHIWVNGAEMTLSE